MTSPTVSFISDLTSSDRHSDHFLKKLNRARLALARTDSIRSVSGSLKGKPPYRRAVSVPLHLITKGVSPPKGRACITQELHKSSSFFASFVSSQVVQQTYCASNLSWLCSCSCFIGSSLQIPHSRLSAVGSCAFSVFGPSTWSDLPLPL